MRCSPKDHGTRCAIGLCVREHKLDLTDRMKSRRKTRIKGIIELSNDNGLSTVLRLVQLHGYFGRYVRILCEFRVRLD